MEYGSQIGLDSCRNFEIFIKNLDGFLIGIFTEETRWLSNF